MIKEAMQFLTNLKAEYMDLNIDCNKVKQVLNFLLERSLFDNKLFQSDKVLTSAGIQRRYQGMVKARAIKTPIRVEGFWLLPEDETEPFIKVNPSLNNSENNHNNSRKNDDNSEKKETKEKENIYIRLRRENTLMIFL